MPIVTGWVDGLLIGQTLTNPLLSIFTLTESKRIPASLPTETARTYQELLVRRQPDITASTLIFLQRRHGETGKIILLQ